MTVDHKKIQVGRQSKFSRDLGKLSAQAGKKWLQMKSNIMREQWSLVKK